MRFYEYEAKQLFGKHGVPLPKGRGSRTRRPRPSAIAAGDQRAGGAQVAGPQRRPHEGRRRAVRRQARRGRPTAAEKILALTINGHTPRGVLVEARAPVAQEYYVGVTWDGFARKPVMIFSDMGGIDIEEVAEKHPEHIGKRHFSTLLPFSDFLAKELIAQRQYQRRRPRPDDAASPRLWRGCSCSTA